MNSEIQETRECSKIYMVNLLTLVACAEILVMNVLLCMPLFVAGEFSKDQMDEEDLAWIMISFPISNFIFAYLMSDWLKYVGRTNMLWLAVIIMTIFTALFGAGAIYVKEARLFFWVCIVCRVMQGLGDQMVRITVNAIIISRYPSDKKEFLGLVNMTMGLMKAFGPVLGGFLF